MIIKFLEMKTVLTLILIALCISVCLASTTRGRPDPNNPGKCIFSGKELQQGENQFPDRCIKVTCHEDGSWIKTGCGTKVYENCKRLNMVDKSLPYPECCKWYFECESTDGKYTVIH